MASLIDNPRTVTQYGVVKQKATRIRSIEKATELSGEELAMEAGSSSFSGSSKF